MNKCCASCNHFGRDNQFCYRNPPTPVYCDGQMKSCYPVIRMPSRDYCQFYSGSTIQNECKDSGKEELLLG